MHIFNLLSEKLTLKGFSGVTEEQEWMSCLVRGNRSFGWFLMLAAVAKLPALVIGLLQHESFVVIWESSFQTSIGKNHFKVDLQSPFGAVGAVCGHIFNRHSRILTSQLHPLQLEL